MSNIIDFTPKADLDAAQQLDAFIAWAKGTLPKGIPNRVHASIHWEMDSWHQSGMKLASFTALNSPQYAKAEDKSYMQPPFLDFAKAMLVYRRVYLGKKDIRGWLDAMKVLEFALVELTGTRDVTQTSAAVCNRACEHMRAKWTKGNNAYIASTRLEQLIKWTVKKGLLATLSMEYATETAKRRNAKEAERGSGEKVTESRVDSRVGGAVQ